VLCCRRPYLESCRGEADELDALFDGEQEERRAAEREAALTSLRQKQRKLLDLHYEDRISAEAFGTEEARIAAQIRALDADAASAAAAARERKEREARFNEIVDVLTRLRRLNSSIATPHRCDLGGLWIKSGFRCVM
jgi:hypothetical protein